MMKFIKNISKKPFNKFAQILFFLLVGALFATVSHGQNINDDLEPKKTVVKTPASTKTAKKPVQPKPTVSKSKINKPVRKTAVVQKAVVPMQTPDQIIERFMDFQQSSSVTYADWQSVVNQTTVTLQSNPNDAKAKAQQFLAKGQLALNGNDFSNALIHFNAAAQVLSDSALPHYGIGRVYLLTKQPNEAEAAFEKAVKLNKDFALAYKGLGDVMTAQGKTKKAQDYYKQAAKIGLARSSSAATMNSQLNVSMNNQTPVPNNSSTNPTPQQSFYDTELKAARRLTAQKKWQGSLDKLLALSKTNPTPDVYISMGDNYYAMEQWLSARQAYQKAAEINPNSAVAFYKSGKVLYELNEYQAAVEAFEKSLILDQTGTTINRQLVRKMADKANEKVQDMKDDGKKKKFLGIGF